MHRGTGLMVAAVASALSAGADADALSDAIDGAKFNVDWRVRQETVDQTGIENTADALTSRLRVGITSGAFHKTTLLAEGVLIGAIVDDYNSTTNGNTDYPVVPDPDDILAVNRFALTNKSLANTTLTLGRQRIALDDQRFVGNVGWRQQEQTFDAVRAVRAGALVKTDLTYASQVNRVFGPDSPAGKWHGDIVLANFALTKPWGTLTFYDYWLDMSNAAAASSNTVGIRLTGAHPLGALTGLYTLSYATQEDSGDNPATFSHSGYTLEGGLKVHKASIGLGYELLAGDGVTSFQTPLATLHAFQGWADKFLVTPADGIEDVYLKLGYDSGALGPFSNVAALVVAHEFDGDACACRYGDEVDVQLLARTKQFTFTVKYSTYSADALFSDTDKFWLAMDYAF